MEFFCKELHLVQGSLYVRERFGRFSYELFRFNTTLLNEVRPNMEVFPKWLLFSNKSNRIENSCIYFRIYFTQMWRSFGFIQATMLLWCRILWASLIFLHFREYILKHFLKFDVTNQKLVKNDDFRGATHGV